MRWRRPPGHCRSPASWRDDGRGETTSCGKRSGSAGSKSRRNGTTRGTTNNARRNGFPRATTSPPRGKIKSGKSLTLPFYRLPRRIANDKPREVSRKIKQQLQHNKIRLALFAQAGFLSNFNQTIRFSPNRHFCFLSNQILNHFSRNDQPRHRRHKRVAARHLSALRAFPNRSRRTDAVLPTTDRRILNRRHRRLFGIHNL